MIRSIRGFRATYSSASTIFQSLTGLQAVRKLLLASVMVVFVSQAAAAPASPESVEALLTATKAESMIESVYASMEQFMRTSMQQAAGGKTLTPEQQQVIDSLPAKFLALMRSEFTWDKLKPQYVQLYRETFDQEEIDGLAAFYRSTAGQAFINKMPIVMQKSMAISQSQMQALFPKIKSAVDQAISEAKLAKNALGQLPTSQIVKDCDLCPGLVAIPGGSFEMGTNDGGDDAKPVHRVNVSGFLLGQTDVTYGQWKALMGSSSGSVSMCGDECPVSRVSWEDAQIYVKKLSERTGKKYRLPSEAEWEYAARAGGTGKWSFGDDESQLGRHAWYAVNSFGRTQAVGQKQANAFGLFDMYGNVWQWVQDVWHPSYGGAPADGAAWMSAGDGELRVLRGGAWFDKPASLQSSYRSWNTSVIHYYGAGLRVARNGG